MITCDEVVVVSHAASKDKRLAFTAIDVEEVSMHGGATRTNQTRH